MTTAAPTLVKQLRALARDSGEHWQLATEAADALERIVKAAEDVCWYDWSDNDADAVEAIQALGVAIGPIVKRIT